MKSCRFCELELESCICPAGPSPKETAAPHPLDARALAKRLEDRDTVIGVLRERVQHLEAAITVFLDKAERLEDEDFELLRAALEVLPPAKGGATRARP